MSRKLALNVVVGLAGFVAFVRLVAVPLYQLLHLGLKPHGSLLEDSEFYYSLVAVSLIRFRRSARHHALVCSASAARLGTPLGFAVPPEDRSKARIWFWYAPFFFFSLEIIGRFQVQRWYAEHGVIFPFTSLPVRLRAASLVAARRVAAHRARDPDRPRPLSFSAASPTPTEPPVMNLRALFLPAPGRRVRPRRAAEHRRHLRR